MKYVIILTLLIASCQSKNKSPLEGKWEFERNELYPGVELNSFQDSMFKVLNEQQRGLTISFKGKTFNASLVREGKTEPMGEQPFEIPGDQKSLILKNRGRADDIFPIVSISDSVFKLNMFKSKEGYLVFRKKN